MFSELDDSSINQLADDFMEREFAEGQSMATEGEGGLNFFVVESGTVDVSVGGRVVGTLGSGDSFGEVALVDKSARSATVTATSPVRAYGLPVWSFRSFAEARPVVLWKLLELLADRLRAAESR
jgi:cAMP-dependent protein kinase regulator